MERVKDRNKIKGLKNGQEKTRGWLVIGGWGLEEKQYDEIRARGTERVWVYECMG